jgi:hypothetical protein
MSNQNTQTAVRRAASVIERAFDRIGVLFLLAMGVGAAGATLLVGM